MSIAAASDFELAPAPARPIVKPLLLAAACVALAWRLKRYLANNPTTPLNSPDSDRG
jgi:hypothetical protein